MRKSILVGFLSFLMMVLSGVAHAQVQAGPGYFGYIDGGLVLNPGSGSAVISNDFPGVTGRGDRGLGFGFEGKGGYRFGNNWDFALGGGYRDYGRGDSAGAFGLRLDDADLWNIDAEAGYTSAGSAGGVRPFMGARFFRFTTDGKDPGNGFEHEGRSWGIGPRVGLDLNLRVAGPISLFGGVDTSLLFGNIRDRNGPGFATSRSDSRFTWQIGTKLGLDWEVSKPIHLALGYKFSYWDGIQSRYAFTFPGVAAPAKGRQELIEHGPFIRVSYNFGTPSVATK